MSEIPKQFKACVYDEPGKISTKIETLQTPVPGHGEVLINLYVLVLVSPQYSRTNDRILILNIDSRTHSGVCFSDMAVMENSVGLHCVPQQGQELNGFIVAIPPLSHSAWPGR